MALIPTDPRQRNLLFVAIGLTAGFYAFHAYVYSPRKTEADAMQARLEELKDRNTRAQIMASRGGRELREKLALYERHIAQLERLIPASEEVPELLNDMALEARQNQVDLALMRPEPAETGQFYTKQSYSMGVIGSYHDVARFLTAIASLPRIVTPIDLQVTPAEEPQQRLAPPGKTYVVASFRIQTYVLPGPAPAAAPAGSGGEGQGSQDRPSASASTSED